MADCELVFLGTGGGRFAMITQARRTGGIRLSGFVEAQLDPGPGALVYSNMAGLNPSSVSLLLVSHCHLDHYSDAEVFVEAMTRGMTRRRGTLIAPRSVLRGHEGSWPCLSSYHLGMPKQILEAKPGDSFEVDGIRVAATRAKHTDPHTIGFRFEFPFGTLAYTSDTEYFEGMEADYKGSRVLIICVLRPRGKPWPGHMDSEGALRLVRGVGPELAILTDFGMKMLEAGPEKEAKWIEEESGVRTLAAQDGMRLRIGDRGVELSGRALDGFLRGIRSG